MPEVLQAGLWGLFAAIGLPVGATIAVLYYDRITHRLIAGLMGFGGGVLIAVLSLELTQKAYAGGGAVATTAGFLAGASLFSFINWRLAAYGAKHRNRCGGCVAQPSETDQKHSGMAIAVGAVLDGVPESLVIGLSFVAGGGANLGLVAGFLLANIPQGLSSASGMKTAGRSNKYIFSVWLGIPVVCGIDAAIGSMTLGSVHAQVPSAVLAFAAGGVLAMLAEAMIPEAFENAQPFIGLLTGVGFLVAFFTLVLSH